MSYRRVFLIIFLLLSAEVKAVVFGTDRGFCSDLRMYGIKPNEYDRNDAGVLQYNVENVYTTEVAYSCSRFVNNNGQNPQLSQDVYTTINGVLELYKPYNATDVSGQSVAVKFLSKVKKTVSGISDGCLIKYYLPNLYRGYDTGFYKEGEKVYISKPGVFYHPDANNCQLKSCDDLTPDEFRAMEYQVELDRVSGFDFGGGSIDFSKVGEQAGKTVYKKFCEPKKSDGSDLYCHEMQNPDVFRWVWTKGKVGDGKADANGNQVYHCKIHQCPRSDSISSLCYTNYDFFLEPRMNVVREDIFGFNISYIKSYERDVLLNDNYENVTVRGIGCSPIPVGSENCSYIRIINQLNGSNVVYDSANVCDIYPGIDNDVISGGQNQHLVAGLSTQLETYNKTVGEECTDDNARNICENTYGENYPTGCISEQKQNCAFNKKSCTKTIDCGLNANKVKDICKDALPSTSWDNTHSAFVRPTPSPKMLEIVCELYENGVRKTYGKYYTKMHDTHKRYCKQEDKIGYGNNVDCGGDDVTEEFKKCVAKKGVVRTVLKRLLFGQEDYPLHPNFDDSDTRSEVFFWMMNAVPMPIPGLWSLYCPRGSKVSATRHIYTGVPRHNYFQSGPSSKNENNVMFCGSTSEWKDFEADKAQDILCGGGATSGNNTNYYDGLVGVTKPSTPHINYVCDLITGGYIGGTGSLYSCYDGALLHCKQPYPDSFYIKGDPTISFSSEVAGDVTGVTLEVCMRYINTGEFGVCGKREVRNDCAFGLCELGPSGRDECVTLTLDDCNIGNIKDDDGNFKDKGDGKQLNCVRKFKNNNGFNDFRARIKKVGRKVYAFVDRTSGGCVGKNTTYFVESSSDIDDIRDANDIYGTCAGRGNENTNPGMNNPFKFGNLHCRDNLTDRTKLNPCADDAAGSCYESGNNQKREFTINDFIGDNPKAAILDPEDCKKWVEQGEGDEGNIYYKGKSGASAEDKNSHCKVLVYKTADKNYNTGADFPKSMNNEHSMGRWFKGRLTALSLFDDNSLSDNNCDNKITDEDVKGPLIFKNMNCAYMLDRNYKIRSSRTGDRVNYILVKSEDWCKTGTEYVKDENNTPFKERFGAGQSDPGDGAKHAFLVNEKCSGLMIDNDLVRYKLQNPENSHKDEKWLPVGVVQYKGNANPDGMPDNNQCGADTINNCRGFYNQEYYTKYTGFNPEEQGATVPIAIAPDVYWRYANMNNMPDLFLPILQLYKYNKRGTNDYLIIDYARNDQILNFFTPGIRVKYNITESPNVVIGFSEQEKLGSIETTYNQQDIVTRYKFKKYGTIYPEAKGLACLSQVFSDASEQQIACLNRGKPTIYSFGIVPDATGIRTKTPWIRAFFHDGNNLQPDNPIGATKNHFLKTNINIEDSRETRDLILKRYSEVDNTTYTSCNQLPTTKNDKAHLSVDNPRLTCNELTERINNGETVFRQLKGDEYAYSGGYPIFMTAGYCSKLHYDCVAHEKQYNILSKFPAENEGLLMVLTGKIRNCEMQIENYCNHINGRDRVVQLDENVDLGKLTYMKENYFANGSHNEICATTGFSEIDANDQSGGAVYVLANRLQYYDKTAQGVGKCVLENDSKKKEICRIKEFFVYCEIDPKLNASENEKCKPIADFSVEEGTVDDRGNAIPFNSNCKISDKNCIKSIDCSCVDDACVLLLEQCFKSGFNIYKTSLTENETISDTCACKIIDINNTGGISVNTNQEIRKATPRELGLCAPLQTLSFCAPVKYYKEDKIYADGGAGNNLNYIINNLPGNVWRTYEKVEGRYYLMNDLGHAEFNKSNVCGNDESWNADFCLQENYKYNTETGEICDSQFGKCKEVLSVIGTCRGFWKNKENSRPLASCKYFTENDGNDFGKECETPGIDGCSEKPALFMMDNTECERYSCPVITETAVYEQGYDELADYSETGEINTDKRGQVHGYAMWGSYKKGSDISECNSNDKKDCEFYDYTKNKPTSRSGAENGRGDDLESRFASACAQGFGPASANTILREFMAYFPNIDTSIPNKMPQYIALQDEYVNVIFGYNLGYYNYRDIENNYRQLDSNYVTLYNTYKNFVDLSGYNALLHLPARLCNQVGEWGGALDLYNIHGITGYYKGLQIFENGLMSNLPDNATDKDKYPEYIGNYCERLYCPGYDEDYAGFLSIEKCNAEETDPNKLNLNCSAKGDNYTINTPTSSKTYKLYYSNENNYDNYPSGLYNSYRVLRNSAGDIDMDDPRNMSLIYQDKYITPSLPSTDTRNNNSINNLYTVWRHAGGAIWEATTTPRMPDVVSVSVQGRCLEDRKFMPSDSKTWKDFETQYNNLFNGYLGDIYSNDGKDHVVQTANLTTQKTTKNGKKVLVTEVIGKFMNPDSYYTQPTRNCGRWGQWSAIKDPCLSVCEALDPFRTEFNDANKNGYLENWEIEKIRTQPKYEGKANTGFYNRLRSEKRTVPGWITMSNGKVCNTGTDEDGNKIDPACICDKANPKDCEEITYKVGYGDYVTKEDSAGNVTWERVLYADMDLDSDQIGENIEHKYKGMRYGDRYTGGAKWPRSLGGYDPAKLTEGIRYQQYVKKGGKVYVVGTCFAGVSKRYKNNATWIDGFPDDGATFLESGSKNDVFGGSPHRECLPDGTWGPVIDPCVNFLTCSDYKINTKNMLQEKIDYTNEANNTPTTSDARLSNGGTTFDFQKIQVGSFTVEDIKQIATLEGGRLNFEDAKNAAAGSSQSIIRELPLEIACAQPSSLFMEKGGYNDENRFVDIAMIGRKCNITSGNWSKGYHLYQCRMKSCGNVSYIIGSGNSAIAIVDYAITTTNEGIGISGKTADRSNGKVINNIEGLFYPKMSGYKGKVEFGEFSSTTKQIFTNYEFRASCPAGYIYCEKNASGEMDCSVPNKQLRFTCDMPDLTSQDLLSQPVWTRTGECVAQSCIWQNDITSGGQGSTKSDAIMGGYGLDWTDRNMIIPYEMRSYRQGADRVYVGGFGQSGLNVVGGLPDLNDYYKPDEDNPGIEERLVTKLKDMTSQKQYVYDYNLSTSEPFAKEDSSSQIPSLLLLMSRKTFYLNDYATDSDAIIVGSVRYPKYMATPLKTYATRKISAPSGTPVITDLSLTLLNTTNDIFFVRDRDNYSYHSLTINSQTDNDELEQLGKVSVGTQLRMDAYCVRNEGKYYPKDEKIIAECQPNPNKIQGKWNITKTGGNEGCFYVCDLEKLPFYSGNNSYKSRDVNGVISDRDDQNSNENWGVVPALIGGIGDGIDSHVRYLREKVRTAEIASSPIADKIMELEKQNEDLEPNVVELQDSINKRNFEIDSVRKELDEYEEEYNVLEKAYIGYEDGSIYVYGYSAILDCTTWVDSGGSPIPNCGSIIYNDSMFDGNSEIATLNSELNGVGAGTNKELKIKHRINILKAGVKIAKVKDDFGYEQAKIDRQLLESDLSIKETTLAQLEANKDSETDNGAARFTLGNETHNIKNEIKVINGTIDAVDYKIAEYTIDKLDAEIKLTEILYQENLDDVGYAGNTIIPELSALIDDINLIIPIINNAPSLNETAFSNLTSDISLINGKINSLQDILGFSNAIPPTISADVVDINNNNYYLNVLSSLDYLKGEINDKISEINDYSNGLQDEMTTQLTRIGQLNNEKSAINNSSITAKYNGYFDRLGELEILMEPLYGRISDLLLFNMADGDTLNDYNEIIQSNTDEINSLLSQSGSPSQSQIDAATEKIKWQNRLENYIFNNITVTDGEIYQELKDGKTEDKENGKDYTSYSRYARVGSKVKAACDETNFYTNDGAADNIFECKQYNDNGVTRTRWERVNGNNQCLRYCVGLYNEYYYQEYHYIGSLYDHSSSASCSYNTPYSLKHIPNPASNNMFWMGYCKSRGFGSSINKVKIGLCSTTGIAKSCNFKCNAKMPDANGKDGTVEIINATNKNVLSEENCLIRHNVGGDWRDGVLDTANCSLPAYTGNPTSMSEFSSQMGAIGQSYTGSFPNVARHDLKIESFFSRYSSSSASYPCDVNRIEWSTNITKGLVNNNYVYTGGRNNNMFAVNASVFGFCVENGGINGARNNGYGVKFICQNNGTWLRVGNCGTPNVFPKCKGNVNFFKNNVRTSCAFSNRYTNISCSVNAGDILPNETKNVSCSKTVSCGISGSSSRTANASVGCNASSLRPYVISTW
ncbi:MAG: hypothetical protein LBC92_00040 [Rickettsiales bacterium]|jgi:hypothetical protein|nr:hypothetical protein [Rickettsiales bacterium]